MGLLGVAMSESGGERRVVETAMKAKATERTKQTKQSDEQQAIAFNGESKTESKFEATEKKKREFVKEMFSWSDFGFNKRVFRFCRLGLEFSFYLITHLNN